MQPDTTSYNLSSSRPHVPASRNARLATRTDLHRALRLLRRSPAARAFMLTPPSPALDLAQLASVITARPHFTIATEEDQSGTLAGRISLRYLGLPSFTNSDGLSGGLVVTTYASRTHPLHAPAVMAHVRVGRYVRDNVTGDWCILTRNRRDRLTRLQYIRTSDAGARERICLTCSSDLFDRGRLLDSVLFNCHDRELRICHRCAAAQCICSSRMPSMSHQSGLAAFAQNVVEEGGAEWLGTVRVTVVSNLSNNPMLNLDETMTVRSSYQPSIDAVLAAEMQRLAIIETAAHAAAVPYPISVAASPTRVNDNRKGSSSRNDDSPRPASTTEETRTSGFHRAASTAAGFELTQASAADPTFDEIFASEDQVEVANHFLIIQEGVISDALSDSPMLPADPSTLPGGNGLCLEGMDLEEPEGLSYFYRSTTSPGASADMGDESLIANALAGADIDHIFFPSNPPDRAASDPMTEVQHCTPSDPSQHKSMANTTPEREPSPPLPPLPTAVDSADAISSLTLGSSASGSTKSRSVCATTMTDRSAETRATTPVCPPATPKREPLLHPVVKSEQVERALEILTAPQSPMVTTTAEPMSTTTKPQTKTSPPTVVPTDVKRPVEVRPPVVHPVSMPSAASTKTSDVPMRGAVLAQPVITMPLTGLAPLASMPVAGIQSAAAAPIAAPGLFPGGAMLAPGAWGMGQMDAAAMTGVGNTGMGGVASPAVVAAASAAATAAHIGGGAAPKLAPRPQGMMVQDGFIWQMGAAPLVNPGYGFAVPAQIERWQRLERERKAEERRKKNRQAAARSNARKKDVMDGYHAEIAEEKQKIMQLKAREVKLKKENEELRQRMNMVKRS